VSNAQTQGPTGETQATPPDEPSIEDQLTKVLADARAATTPTPEEVAALRTTQAYLERTIEFGLRPFAESPRLLAHEGAEDIIEGIKQRVEFVRFIDFAIEMANPEVHDLIEKILRTVSAVRQARSRIPETDPVA